MLFNDSPISTYEDWLSYDTKLRTLTEIAGAKIEEKAELAKNAILTEIQSFLIREIGLGPIAARTKTQQLTITEPLKRWHTLATLALYYEDLANLQSSDNHRAQSLVYTNKLPDTRKALYSTGLGFVSNPIPKGPTPSATSSNSTQPARFLRARATYVGANGAEGTPGDEFTLDQSGGQNIVLLVPASTAAVTGWMLYLSSDESNFRRATSGAFPLGTSVALGADWPQTNSVLVEEGQPADHYIVKTQQVRG